VAARGIAATLRVTGTVTVLVEDLGERVMVAVPVAKTRPTPLGALDTEAMTSAPMVTPLLVGIVALSAVVTPVGGTLTAAVSLSSCANCSVEVENSGVLPSLAGFDTPWQQATVALSPPQALGQRTMLTLRSATARAVEPEEPSKKEPKFTWSEAEADWSMYPSQSRLKLPIRGAMPAAGESAGAAREGAGTLTAAAMREAAL